MIKGIIRKGAGIVAGIGLTLSIHAQTTQTTEPPQTTETPPTYNAPEEAQTSPPPNENDHWGHHEELYHANEFSVDLFGVATLNESQRIHGVITKNRNASWGGGAGVNYFLTKNLGIGGDFYSITFKRSFVDTTTGNLIFRFPLGDCGLAPYIFAGAGYQLQGIDQIVGGGGGGLEYRPCPHLGLFADFRWLAAVKTRGYGLARAGIRLSF